MNDFQEQAKNWLRNVVKQNPDKIKAGVEKAGDLIDKKTGGKYAEKVDAAQEKVGNYVDTHAAETSTGPAGPPDQSPGSTTSAAEEPATEEAGPATAESTEPTAESPSGPTAEDTGSADPETGSGTETGSAGTETGSAGTETSSAGTETSSAGTETSSAGTETGSVDEAGSAVDEGAVGPTESDGTVVRGERPTAAENEEPPTDEAARPDPGLPGPRQS